MKTYIPIPEDAEYREMFDSYNLTVDNLNSTDFLYETMLTNGQVFFKDDEVYGFVNGQPAVRNRNIIIPRSYIDDFTITNFKVYTRATNTLLDLDITCNLADYRDGKPHYLYIVLDTHGTYEVYDDMFQSDETKLLFARFIIGTDGNSIQFYMMLPFGGSADYIKGNQFYQVTDGLRVNVVNNATKQITLSNAKIRFSAINFDDKSSPDCLEVNFEGNALPIRYVYWDSTDRIPRVDWVSNPTNSLVLDTIMDYETGAISSVANGKYSIQKFYYDVYEECIVAMYGDRVYNDRDDAIYSIDSVMNYPLPDGITYLIPIACIVMENTADPIDDSNFRIINLDYNEQEVLDSDSFTRQQAAEAIEKANELEVVVGAYTQTVDNHINNRTNPHKVRVDQLYDSQDDPCVLDDSFVASGMSVTAIINQTLTQADSVYYKKTGGTISGNASISGTLSVTQKTTLAALEATSLKLTGNVTFDNSNRNIGTTTNQVNNLYVKTVAVSTSASITALTSGNITPTASASYDIGTSNSRWRNAYLNNIYSNGTISGASGTFSGTLGVTGAVTAGGISCTEALTMSSNKRISVSNGYLVIGDYSLRLGGSGAIPTQNGYGIW
ncbi:MAG: S-layer family protein [Bacilli bacterium]|nr:S-layer family protein [Bacilli bacterium]